MDMELSIIKEEVPMNPRVVLGIVRHVRDSWAVFHTSQIRILSSVLTYTLWTNFTYFNPKTTGPGNFRAYL